MPRIYIDVENLDRVDARLNRALKAVGELREAIQSINLTGLDFVVTSTKEEPTSGN